MMHGNFSKAQPSGDGNSQAASRSERIRAGIAQAKREGTRSGRPFGRPRLSEETLDAVRQSILAGDSLHQTVRKTGVGMGTVTRLRKELKAQRPNGCPPSPRHWPPIGERTVQRLRD